VNGQIAADEEGAGDCGVGWRGLRLWIHGCNDVRCGGGCGTMLALGQVQSRSEVRAWTPPRQPV
jgi:hypothetical protein